MLAAALVSTLLGMTLSSRTGSAQETSRYPYDPACPWGRLSNGKGMLVRCITKSESQALTASKPPAASPATAATASASAPTASTDPPPTAPDLGSASLASLTVAVDEGALPAAEKKLRAAKQRYEECIDKNGGLEKPDAEVRVRFLVRPRGRAEGVSVSHRSGASAQAADCVAHVVDRRWVGTPEAPLVGATAVFKFSRVKK